MKKLILLFTLLAFNCGEMISANQMICYRLKTGNCFCCNALKECDFGKEAAFIKLTCEEADELGISIKKLHKKEK